MTKDANFDIPVTNASYVGSDRAKKAMSMAKSQNGPGKEPVANSDEGNSPADSNDNLKQSMNPRVLADMTKPTQGATTDDSVDPMGRPGMNAPKINHASQGRTI